MEFLPEDLSLSTAQLTLEQQFQIRSFETKVEQMNQQQAQQFLVQLYIQMMTREAIYKQLLKHEWGCGEPLSSNPETT